MPGSASEAIEDENAGKAYLPRADQVDASWKKCGMRRLPENWEYRQISTAKPNPDSRDNRSHLLYTKTG